MSPGHKQLLGEGCLKPFQSWELWPQAPATRLHCSPTPADAALESSGVAWGQGQGQKPQAGPLCNWNTYHG